MSGVILRRTDDLRTVEELHRRCLPGDEFDLEGQLWLAYAGDKPVAFCSARKLKHENAVFLSRAGVLPCARGAGLQRRMIHARVRWAREIGARTCITYTVFDNHPSIVNLLRSGFQFYVPHYRWAGDVHYFRRDL